MKTKFQYRIWRHHLSEVEATITYGKWTKDNPTIARLSVSRFHARADEAIKILVKGACDALNKELEQ